MKKFIIFTNLLLIFNFTNGQVSTGHVEYSLNFGNDKTLDEGELADYFKMAKENASSVSYILNFNNEEMNFYSNTPDTDNVNIAFSFAFSGIHGVYYRKMNEITVFDSVDDYTLGKIIFKRDLNADWKLHDESKKIQGFLCYKATITTKYNNGVGDFEKELIVWYCPEIPYSYGPKGYGGLPGLILEFQDGNIVVGAKKIVFDNEVEISEPQGETITEAGYIELLKNRT